jgi:hypothetical protein
MIEDETLRLKEALDAAFEAARAAAKTYETSRGNGAINDVALAASTAATVKLSAARKAYDAAKAKAAGKHPSQ